MQRRGAAHRQSTSRASFASLRWLCGIRVQGVIEAYMRNVGRTLYEAVDGSNKVTLEVEANFVALPHTKVDAGRAAI